MRVPRQGEQLRKKYMLVVAQMKLKELNFVRKNPPFYRSETLEIGHTISH